MNTQILQISTYNLTAYCLYPQTNYTTSFALYHLATNPEVQNKLYEESCRLLIEPNSPVTTAILSQAQYMKAVLKESLRLNPISVGIGRILAHDAVLSGYHVPKGVSTQLDCQGCGVGWAIVSRIPLFLLSQVSNRYQESVS